MPDPTHPDPDDAAPTSRRRVVGCVDPRRQILRFAVDIAASRFCYRDRIPSTM